MLWLGYGILTSLLAVTLGRTALLLMTCQQLTVIAFTQIMSYVLHYGLVRQREPSGRCVSFTYMHACT